MKDFTWARSKYILINATSIVRHAMRLPVLRALPVIQAALSLTLLLQVVPVFVLRIQH